MKLLFYAAISFSMIACVIFYCLRENKVFIEDYGKEWSLGIKGAAIICVVFSHLGELFGIRYLNPLGAVGVSAFLIISGYGLEASYTRRGGVDYFWRRKIGVYVAYLITEIAGYISFWRPVSVTEVLLDILLIKPLHPYGWYMNYLLVSYVVFYLSKKYLKGKMQNMCLLLFSVVFFVLQRDLIAENAFSFTIGCVLFQNRTVVKSFFEKKRNFTLCVLVGLIFLFIKQIPMVRNLPFLVYRVVLSGVCTALGLSIFSMISLLQKRKEKCASVLIKLGEVSYEIYLTHYFLIQLILIQKISFIRLIIFYCVGYVSAYLLKGITKYISGRFTK